MLVFSPRKLSEDGREEDTVMEASAKAILSGNRRLLSRYAVKIESIPAIFTEEPQFTFKTMLGYGTDREMQTIPYTDDFEDTYYMAYQRGFLEYLPEVFWDLPDGNISASRYYYQDHVCERFTTAFADQVGAWCKAHNIMLTGHMMREPFLESQTMALGEAMRSYRAFDISGIDMLCDRRELTTAKQAQSAVHQFDRLV